MYILNLTEQDFEAIVFTAGRYCWGDALIDLEVGDNELAEHEAWEICEAFERDTEGEHSYFPCLDQRSELAEKLYQFMDSVV